MFLTVNQSILNFQGCIIRQNNIEGGKKLSVEFTSTSISHVKQQKFVYSAKKNIPWITIVYEIG